MNLVSIKEELESLLEDLPEEDEDIDQRDCNKLIRDFEDIKDSLRNSGLPVIRKLQKIRLVEAVFGLADPEEVDSALNEIERQAKNILRNIESTPTNAQSNHNGGVNINVSPSFNQSQHQHQTVINDNHIEVGRLIVELENELEKSYPDKPKQKSLIQKILGFGKEYAPKVLELLLKYWPRH